MQTQPRTRVTISLAPATLAAADAAIDGIKIRNRSQAIELALERFVSQSQPITNLVILIGGAQARDRALGVNDVLEQATRAGIERVWLVLSSAAEIHREHLLAAAGQALPNCMLHISNQGSAGALHELDLPQAPFYVLDCTARVRLPFKQLQEFHRQHQPQATLGTRSMTNLEGLYIFERSVVDSIHHDFAMLDEHLFPELMKQAKLLLYPIVTN
jgi:hypothetical protein